MAVELPCFKHKDVESDGLSASLISSSGGYAPCKSNSRSGGQQGSWSTTNRIEPKPSGRCCRLEKIVLTGLLALAVCFTGTTSFYYMQVHAAMTKYNGHKTEYDVEIIPGGRTSATTLARLNYEVDALCQQAAFASCYIQVYQYTCTCEIVDSDEQWSWKVTMPKSLPNDQLYRMVWLDGDGQRKRMTWKKALAFKDAKSL